MPFAQVCSGLVKPVNFIHFWLNEPPTVVSVAHIRSVIPSESCSHGCACRQKHTEFLHSVQSTHLINKTICDLGVWTGRSHDWAAGHTWTGLGGVPRDKIGPILSSSCGPHPVAAAASCMCSILHALHARRQRHSA